MTVYREYFRNKGDLFYYIFDKTYISNSIPNSGTCSWCMKKPRLLFEINKSLYKIACVDHHQEILKLCKNCQYLLIVYAILDSVLRLNNFISTHTHAHIPIIYIYDIHVIYIHIYAYICI